MTELKAPSKRYSNRLTCLLGIHKIIIIIGFHSLNDISGRDMTLLFSRPDAQDAESPVQFGTPPDIITPLPSDVFSVSTDDIYVTFPPDTTGPDSMTTFISDSCRREVSDTNPLTTTLILHPNTYNCASTTAHIRISRSWYPAIAPTLNQTLSYTRTRISKQITLQYFP